jgi:hypothetical protein
MEQEQKPFDPIVEKWKENYKRNIEQGIFSKDSVRYLKFLSNNQVYNKIPCILVAAGPSLDKNIDILKKYQQNYLIICADVVLYRLVEEDIHPDFVCSIDPSDSFSRFWKDIDTSNYNLVCPTTASSISLNEWKGTIFFFNPTDKPESDKQKVLSELTKLTSRFGDLENNYFVGATMFLFSRIFNPSCIIFIGYDFGFTDNTAYCKGFLDRKLYDNNNVGMDLLKKRELNHDLIVDIDYYFIKTTTLLVLYRNTLLDLIFSSKIKCINSTEGGILTEILRMPLEDSIKEFCHYPITKVCVNVLPKRKRR